MSNSLRPHELQHTRSSCPSPSPGVHSSSRPLNWWCHPAISSSIVPFSSCPQSLPASESFPMSQLFEWVGQSTGVSALASFPPKKSQGWSPSEWTGWKPATEVAKCLPSIAVLISATGSSPQMLLWAGCSKIDWVWGWGDGVGGKNKLGGVWD